MDTMNEGKELSMEDLLGQLGDFSEYNELKQKVSQIEKSKAKVSAALPRAQRERLERKAAYEESKGEVSLWSGIVMKNREKTSITFDEAEPGKYKLTSNSMASSFRPTTDMEKEIDVILEGSDMKEKGIQDKESRDLAVNKLSVEEVKARNQELARMKSLMFYQEQKNKRINKIKSKKYHKIHKKAEERRKEKEREMLKETDPALYRELLEKDAMKRAQERISLKHKNTSKWVKRALRYGMQDQNTRDAINEQLREGEKLRRRMEGIQDENSSENESDEDGEVDNAKLLEEAGAVLDDLDNDTAQRAKGVFQMAFMKRALEKQREEARQEAEKLMQALREEEAFDAEPGVDDMDSDEENTQQNPHHDVNDDDEEEEEREGEDSEQAAQIREALRTNTGVVRRQKQKGKSLEVTEHIAAKPMFEAPVVASMFGDDDNNNNNNNNNDKSSGMKSSHQAASNLLDDLDDEEEEEENGDGNDDDLLEGDDDLALLNGDGEGDEGDEEEMQGNPWLLAAEDNVGHSNERKSAATSGKDEETVDIAGTVAKLEERAEQKKSQKRTTPATTHSNSNSHSHSNSNSNSNINTTSEKRERDGPRVVIIDAASKAKEQQQSRGPVRGVLGMEDLSQEELMARAFGTEGEEETFAEEKAAIEAEDVEEYKKAHGLQEQPELEGWGSWAGIGAPEPKRRKPKKEVKVNLPERSDAHLKHVIINQQADKKADAFRIEGVPFPFTSREQYERAMRQPLGREWNASNSFQELNKPEVKTRLGTIIDPIKKPKRKQHRKF